MPASKAKALKTWGPGLQLACGETVSTTVWVIVTVEGVSTVKVEETVSVTSAVLVSVSVTVVTADSTTVVVMEIVVGTEMMAAVSVKVEVRVVADGPSAVMVVAVTPAHLHALTYFSHEGQFAVAYEGMEGDSSVSAARA